MADPWPGCKTVEISTDHGGTGNVGIAFLATYERRFAGVTLGRFRADRRGLAREGAAAARASRLPARAGRRRHRTRTPRGRHRGTVPGRPPRRRPRGAR